MKNRERGTYTNWKVTRKSDGTRFTVGEQEQTDSKRYDVYINSPEEGKIKKGKKGSKYTLSEEFIRKSIRDTD